MRFNQKRNPGVILQQRVLKSQIGDIADIPTIH